MKRDTKYVIGNWKMEPRTALEAESLFLNIKKATSKIKSTKIVVCPPSIFIGDIQSVYRGSKIHIGAQDVFWENPPAGGGAFTGEISVSQLKDGGVEYVIVGHSERRAIGEGNDIIAQKLLTILQANLVPVLCVGELQRDHSGEYFAFIKEEIESALRSVPHNKIKKVIIAYEPVWAIGKGNDAMRPHDIHEMSIYIRKILVMMFGKVIAQGVSILYGGSVESSNAQNLIEGGAINGFLLGHISLNPNHFAEIVSIVDKA